MSINSTEAEIKKFLWRNLAPEKYRHTLRTARVAVRLAGLHGVSVKKARLAGLLHDCGKNIEKPEIKRHLKGLKLSKFEKALPALWHTVAGAAIAKKVFGVKDKTVLNAIRRHSVGGLKMTKLDEVIYLADKLEPGRKYAGISYLRRAARLDLRKAVGLALFNNLAYLKAAGKKIHPGTAAIYGKYKKYV